MNEETAIPTNLFVGSDSTLHRIITEKLQDAFCAKPPTSPECFCNECRKIKNNQHASIIWLTPEKQYLLSDLTIIFEKIRFSLDAGEHFFFIIEKAHLLTPVCANRLLKTLEEPPPGYHFYLLTNNEHSIIPTIRSRCSLHQIKSSYNELLVHPLLLFFIDQQKLKDAFYFDQELRNQKPSEQETITLLQDLTHSIQRRLIQTARRCIDIHDLERLEQDKNYVYLQNVSEFLHEQQKKPPQAGSSTLFWKKMFLTFPRK